MKLAKRYYKSLDTITKLARAAAFLIDGGKKFDRLYGIVVCDREVE